MAGSKYQKIKILYLLDILWYQTDEDHPITAEKLCLKLKSEYDVDCERKSIYSDVAILRDAGYDIEQNRKGFYIAERDFQTVELRILTDAVAASSSITKKKTAEIIKKLGKGMSIYQRKCYSNVYVEKRNKAKNEQIYYAVDAIERAIGEGKKLSFNYINVLVKNGKLKESKKEFTVSPYAMFWMEDKYYLICNDAHHDNLIHMRLDRIKNINVLDEPCRSFTEVSDYKKTFDVSDYVGHVYKGFGGKPKRIKLKCKNEAAKMIIDEFGDSVTIKPFDDDYFLCEVLASDSEGLIKTILQIGPSVEIISPKTVREKIKNQVKALNKIYK